VEFELLGQGGVVCFLTERFAMPIVAHYSMPERKEETERVEKLKRDWAERKQALRQTEQRTQQEAKAGAAGSLSTP